MSLLADMKMYARFMWGLRGFLRHQITLEEAVAMIRQRLAERDANFLRLLEKGIFGHQRSPYRPLLKLAGCELGDIRNMGRTKGLEDTLRALRDAGVYITFEEFKGREPIVRGGQVFPVQANDFDNPYLSHYYYTRTGGTTGAGTRVAVDLDHKADGAPHTMLAHHAHGTYNVPTADWFEVFPDGFGYMLSAARVGQIPEKWFSPVMGRDMNTPLQYYLAYEYINLMTRLTGVRFPKPEPVPLSKAVVIARWAAEALKTHGKCSVRGHVSKVVRVAVAASEAGLDLTGAIFSGSGEPPTPAKVREITRTGARWFPNYFCTEMGRIGTGCAQPADGNDVHFLKDVLALIQHPRQVPGTDITVDAFYFTSLLPTSPKLLLNVEIDDYGVIETRSCGCPLEEFGFTEHIRHIYSFRKLTGEGVTLIGSEMIRILEEVLPARFGGSSLDYQLSEEEDEHGLTRLSLLVSPKIEIADESAVIQTVMDALARSSIAAGAARAIWGQANTLRVKRMEPIWTARGKLMPLRLARRVEQSQSVQGR